MDECLVPYGLSCPEFTVLSLCLSVMVKVSQPRLQGNIVAGSLIGAMFARSFGVDGMWEGMVTKVGPRVVVWVLV